MSDHARIVFNAVWKMLPALRCEMKIDKVEITTAKVNRISLEKTNSELGRSIDSSPVVDFLKAQAPKPDEDYGGIVLGDTAKVRLAGFTEWKEFRIQSVQQLGTDVLRVALVGEFQ